MPFAPLSVRRLLGLSVGLVLFTFRPGLAAESSTEWVDPDTGHRVVQLSREPGSMSVYFHYRAFTAEGDKMIIATPRGLDAVNLKTREIDHVVDGAVPRGDCVNVGQKTRQVYYVRDGIVYATHIDAHATRTIGKLPPEAGRAGSLALNADETLLAGTYVKGRSPDEPTIVPAMGDPANRSLEARWAARKPMALYTLNIQTGAIKVIHESNEWLNHHQFSPTDPTLLMFCHEGPWQNVDRTWLIRTDGTGLTQVHHRTMRMEIAGHEFWSHDGHTVWYDLQTPRAEVFWLAGYNVETGERTWYHLQRNEWSVHYNISPDGKLFAGDGGGPNSVAGREHGAWIYLFRPELARDNAQLTPEQSRGLITSGEFHAERLVNLAKHDYHLEPNLTFTPDMKWIVFRSNMSGASQVYAVEIAPAK